MTKTATDNPLLRDFELAPFSEIRPEHMLPAVEQAIAGARAGLDQVLKDNGEYRWANLVAPLEALGLRLSRIWSPIGHMNAVVNSEALREAYNACLPPLTEYSTEMGQHEGLYAAYAQIRESAEFERLDAAQQKVICDALRDFRLSGIGLPEDKKRRYAEIQQRLSELTTKFEENILDATMAWTWATDAAEALKGLPDTALAAARQAAEARELEGWVLTLEAPSYIAAMTYAEDRALRETLYRAYTTRASDQGPSAGQFDNGPIMDELLALRHELAILLGFGSYAEKSLATKMAHDPAQVLEFLHELAAKAKAQGQRDVAELRAFAAERLDMAELEAWDLAYVGEKLRQHRYAISEEEVRPYFPENRVLPGLFAVAKQLFGIRVREKPGVDVWHESVKFYEVLDESGSVRAGFYLDLYARPHKRGGAWMDGARDRWRRPDGSLQTPVAYLTCNFNGPVGGKPALFSHDEVITLFHEFGHGLHHMLTQVDYAAVSGINGVPWDAVELPSQFLENFCWDPAALKLLSGHVDTGEPIPDALYAKMLAAKNFQSAYQMLRQLEFSLFDFRLYGEYAPERGARVQEILDEVRAEVSAFRPPAFNRFQHSFSHIFAGGYSAGYYSYKWAEVLSADAFSRFEEEGVFNPEVGADFRRHILEMGGSKEPAELFRAFRGRDPSIEPLLRHNGIETA
ncbi:MAG: oligopeptidase A [Gammaproteobacteria bacterium]|nr:oligopeptidase A [Gammaproteobacteria bacterium]